MSSIYEVPKDTRGVKLVNALWEGTKPGIDGLDIFLKFEVVPIEFQVGKVITYDHRDGSQLFIRGISGDIVYCTLLTTEVKSDWVPIDKLRPGLGWYVVGNMTGEFSVMG